jgi:hypothetical protein
MAVSAGTLCGALGAAFRSKLAQPPSPRNFVSRQPHDEKLQELGLSRTLAHRTYLLDSSGEFPQAA